MKSDPLSLDATGQAELVRSGEIAPTELVRAAGAASATAYACNAIVAGRFDRALVETTGVGPDAPFRGVPLVLKDLGCAIAGEPLWKGNRTLRALDRRPTADSALAAAFRAAGFGLVARTATAEFGSTITTEPSATGPCRSPWRADRSAGGSSGGSAVAVASGMVPVAHGTDASGSVRIPSALCGVVGFKPGSPPSDGHTALRLGPGDLGGWFGLATPGLMARSVRDIRGVLDALSPLPEVRSRAGRTDGAWESAQTRPLTVLVVDPDAGTLPPSTVRALRGVADLLVEQGHVVMEGNPEFLVDQRFHRRFVTLVAAALLAEIRISERESGASILDGGLDDPTSALVGFARRLDGAAVGEAFGELSRSRELARTWWAGGPDVLVTPVLPVETPGLGWFTDPDAGPNRVREALKYTPHANVYGLPAMSLPLATTDDGLPLGLQLIAAPAREALLLDLARDLERLLPWADRRAPAGPAPSAAGSGPADRKDRS